MSLGVAFCDIASRELTVFTLKGGHNVVLISPVTSSEKHKKRLEHEQRKAALTPPVLLAAGVKRFRSFCLGVATRATLNLTTATSGNKSENSVGAGHRMIIHFDTQAEETPGYLPKTH